MSEIDYRENNTYTVYLHTSPSGKYYVGITKLKPEIRWGKNGCGYTQQGFYNAITKYGWENFDHEIIAQHLTFEEACKMEIIMIQKLQSNNSEYGYNNDSGGRYQFHSVEDLSGQKFQHISVLNKIDIKRNKTGEAISMYDCECDCGEKLILNNIQIKYNRTILACDKCKEKYFKQQRKINFKSNTTKTYLDLKNNYTKIETPKGIVVCDSKYFDKIKNYTFRIELKNGTPSRVRGKHPELEKCVNLEKLLFTDKNFNYVIFKNSHLDYREENLFFVSTSIFTFYHHLLNNINNPNYLIKKYIHKNTTKYYLDDKFVKKWSDLNYKPKRFFTIEEAIKERNIMLNQITDEAIRFVVSKYYSITENKKEAA